MWKPAGAAVVAALLFALPAMAQTAPSYAVSGALPGQIAKFGAGGRVGSGGDLLGDAAGNGVNPFSVLDRNGDGVCLRTAGASASHNAMCIGHDAAGNGLVTLDSLGGLAAKKLYLRLNGTLLDLSSLATLDCADTGGKHINITGGIFSCGTSGGSGGSIASLTADDGTTALTADDGTTALAPL